ncbi:MAG: M48 family metalloprotease [Proteobacteria bacterium]|nr:M48 family metalloprotease [Pseudomonadota bacterium]
MGTELLALLAACGLAGGLSLLGTGLAMLFSRPGPRDLHWTERARLDWTARRTAGLGLLVALLFSVGAVFWMSRDATSLDDGVLLAGLTIAAWLSSRWLVVRRELALSAPGADVSTFKRGRRALSLSLYGHVYGLLLLALASGWAPLQVAPLWLAIGVALVLVFSRGAGVDMSSWFGGASPATGELLALVRARPGGEHVRSVHILEVHHANAMAFPLSGRLAVTRGLLEHLDEAGLAGILDHELGHLAEPRKVILVRVLSVLSLVPLILAVPLVTQLNPWSLGVLVVVVFMILRLGQRMRKRMEERADAHAHEGDPAAYARGLEALHRANGTPAVLGKPPHPDLYDRMIAAGVQPDWPKPEAPSKWRPRLVVAGVTVALALLVVPLRIALDVALAIP